MDESTLEQGTCPRCGDHFEKPTARRVYCSDRCQQAAAGDRYRSRLPAIGSPLPGRASKIVQCAVCLRDYDLSIRRNTVASGVCSGACYEWRRQNPGRVRDMDARKCPVCGKSIAHRNGNAKTCESRRCSHWNLKHPGAPLPGARGCLSCGVPVEHRGIGALYCGAACKTWARTHPDGAMRPLSRACARCGIDISERGSRAIFCSEACFYASPEQLGNARRQAKRRRARIAGGVLFPFTDSQVAERMSVWGDRCYVCGSTDRVTVDHVKPVRAGGMHGLANFRPMCLSCNSIKAAAWPIPRELLLRRGTADERLALLRTASSDYHRRRRRKVA